MDWTALFLSLKLALVATTILMLLTAPLACLLAYSRLPGKAFIEAFINLPLAMPPTVVGFYLLLLMGPEGSLGRIWTGITGSPLLFTFAGIVIASIIYSIPFALQPMRAAFEKVDPRLIDSARVLGLSAPSVFARVILPNSLNGIAASSILVFLHALGAFGVILMVGGSVPGETRVASIAIYEAVETLQYGSAARMSLALLPICYVFLLIVHRLTRSGSS
ncbi:MAG: Molybdenum transport system permease protein ModB [Syntrophaceae bacterium PtaB.Bin095]|jgi:molybdate transport system permease protein|nr:MAG: Molybdenum transport system permease protein ModB [Syntrophaceae bacterium PtaB.Bin095]